MLDYQLVIDERAPDLTLCDEQFSAEKTGLSDRLLNYLSENNYPEDIIRIGSVYTNETGPSRQNKSVKHSQNIFVSHALLDRTFPWCYHAINWYHSRCLHISKSVLVSYTNNRSSSNKSKTVDVGRLTLALPSVAAEYPSIHNNFNSAQLFSLSRISSPPRQKTN